jgi:hypothetical protein
VIAFGTLIFTYRLYEYLIGCPEGPQSRFKRVLPDFSRCSIRR